MADSKKNIVDRISKTKNDFIRGIKEEMDPSSTTGNDKRQTKSVSQTIKDRVADTSSPEQISVNTWGWFWVMVFGGFACLMGVVIGLSSSKYLLMGILLIVALPIWIIWCMLHMIPEIRIFGFTVFSRKSLSLRRQLSVSKEITRVFTRTFIREAPEAAFCIFGFFILLVLAIILAIAG